MRVEPPDDVGRHLEVGEVARGEGAGRFEASVADRQEVGLGTNALLAPPAVAAQRWSPPAHPKVLTDLGNGPDDLALLVAPKRTSRSGEREPVRRQQRVADGVATPREANLVIGVVGGDQRGGGPIGEVVEDRGQPGEERHLPVGTHLGVPVGPDRHVLDAIRLEQHIKATSPKHFSDLIHNIKK